ncbi:Cck [Acrasis kona]|uniref:Cck n=1 Tax=Acrasis kona TaxID=1008807 RepID=A0AAW2Z4S2_9EUKA
MSEDTPKPVGAFLPTPPSTSKIRYDLPIFPKQPSTPRAATASGSLSARTHRDNVSLNSTVRKNLQLALNHANKNVQTNKFRSYTARPATSPKRTTTAPKRARGTFLTGLDEEDDLSPTTPGNNDKENSRISSLTARPAHSPFTLLDVVPPTEFLQCVESARFSPIDHTDSDLGVIDLVLNNNITPTDMPTYISPLTHGCNVLFGGWIDKLDSTNVTHQVSNNQTSIDSIISQRIKEQNLKAYKKESQAYRSPRKNNKLTLFENHLVSMAVDPTHQSQERSLAIATAKVMNEIKLKESNKDQTRMDQDDISNLIQTYVQDKRKANKQLNKLKKEEDDDHYYFNNEQSHHDLLKISARRKKKALDNKLKDLRNDPYKLEELKNKVKQYTISRTKRDKIQKHIKLFQVNPQSTQEDDSYFSHQRVMDRRSTNFETHKNKIQKVLLNKDQIHQELMDQLNTKYQNGKEKQEKAQHEREQRPYKEILAKRCKILAPAVLLSNFVIKVDQIITQARIQQQDELMMQLSMNKLGFYFRPMIRRFKEWRRNKARSVIRRNCLPLVLYVKIKLRKRAATLIVEYLQDLKKSRSNTVKLLKFISCVKNCQRISKNFITCRRAQVIAITLYYEKIQSELNKQTLDREFLLMRDKLHEEITSLGAKTKKIGSFNWARGVEDYAFMIEMTKNAQLMCDDLLIQCCQFMNYSYKQVFDTQQDIRDELICEDLKQRRKQQEFKVLPRRDVMEQLVLKGLALTEERTSGVVQADESDGASESDEIM